MKIDFEKCGGLVPAIIQDANTKNVLMLGYMNQEAFDKTLATKKVTFWSRSRNCLWTKGETSGNFLNLVDMKIDCDNETALPATKVPTPAGAKRTPCSKVRPCRATTRCCSSQSCRTSSTVVMKRCQRAATLRRCSRTASTALPRKWAKKLWRLLSKPPTVLRRSWSTKPAI